ncbi:hypothetical protein QEH42_gp059 [Microbacterium phage Pumpernickel]|uniref:Uncharacterized protein n=1 Tax=Microbacterium phage Pumpernickel TaxID=2885983 RepID=A0AAE8Y7A3_9CAUD|nr:hypothetical protein QEH42_gp059 [Microbacterium phage Pumpernickel]UDL15850.1 hypothetical protein SEA_PUMPERNICKEL_59 [Microbacterium phage Pumpernickel]
MSLDSFEESKLTLGTPVRYDHRVVRRADNTETRHLRRHWVRTEVQHRDAWRSFPTRREGIIVGKRTYANGSISYGEYGGEFAADSYVQVYLVAWDMRKTPDAVLASDLTILDHSEPEITVDESEKVISALDKLMKMHNFPSTLSLRASRTRLTEAVESMRSKNRA